MGTTVSIGSRVGAIDGALRGWNDNVAQNKVYKTSLGREGLTEIFGVKALYLDFNLRQRLLSREHAPENYEYTLPDHEGGLTMDINRKSAFVSKWSSNYASGCSLLLCLVVLQAL